MNKSEAVLEGWDKFQFLITEEAQRVILPAFDESNSEIGEALWNTLFDTGGPTVTSQKPSNKELFFGKIFQGFLEIDSSVRTLNDIEIYIATFPYRNKPITKPRHLRYHLENYFNEIYLLKERLKAYLTKIGRYYKKDNRHQSILRRTRPIFRVVRNSLKGIIETRRVHVHVVRFSDKDLDRLESMELFHTAGFGSNDANRLFDNYYKFTYRLIRSKWKKTLKNNRTELYKLLNIYSEVLIDILFNDKTGEMIYPSDIIDT